MRWVLLAAIPATAFVMLFSTPPPLEPNQLGNGTLETVLLTAGRWVGLALTGWLVATQLLYTIAVLTHTNWMTDALRPVTLPIVRRIAAGAATITITLNSVTAVAQTIPEPPTAVIIEQGQPQAGLRDESTPTPILQPRPEPEPKTPRPCDPIEPVASYSAALTWHVQPGEHLWSIAGDHLTFVSGKPPTRSEHRHYWVHLVDAARPVIRSGNPDLIYPGEHIPLPPTHNAGTTP